MIVVMIALLMAGCLLAGLLHLAEFLISGHLKWGVVGMLLLFLAAIAPWIARSPW